MTQESAVRVTQQGDVHLLHNIAYGVISEDCACLFLDVHDRAEVEASWQSDSGCPVVYLARADSEAFTEVEFSGFAGWRLHSAGTGKSIAVALVRIAAEENGK